MVETDVRGPEPKKPTRLKKIVAGGLTAAVLGTGGFVGYKTLESSHGQPTPTPTAIESITPTPSPEIKLKPTGDLTYKGKPVPLTVLYEQTYISEGLHISNSYISGILTDISKNKQGYYIARMISLNAGGDEVKWNVLLGNDKNHITQLMMTGKQVLREFTTMGGGYMNTYDVSLTAAFLDKNLGEQFIFGFYTSPFGKGDKSYLESTPYGRKHIPDNARLTKTLQSQTDKHFRGLAITDFVVIPLTLQTTG